MSVESNYTNCFGFALLRSVIGSKFSRHFFNQSEVKPKPIVARACTFSRALCRLRVITSSLGFDWFTGLSPSFVIGQSNYFGFGFTILDLKLGSISAAHSSSGILPEKRRLDA